MTCEEQSLVMVSFIPPPVLYSMWKRWVYFPLETPLENLLSLRHLEVFTVHFFSSPEQSELKVMPDNEPVLLVASRYGTNRKPANENSRGCTRKDKEKNQEL